MAAVASKNNKSASCCECGARLLGVAFRELGGRKYCEKCYAKAVAAKLEFDKAQEDLYAYIREIFGVESIPPEVSGAITKAISYDHAQWKGLKATIWYYYKILGNKPVIEFLPKVLREQYESARAYLVKQRELREKNMKVDLNVKPRVVVVRRDNHSNRNVPKYRMEDL